MSNVEIKICGITSEEAIIAASKYQCVKYLGFVTYSKSKRHLTIEQAGRLTKLVPKHIKRVSVLVGMPTDDFIDKTQNMYDYFQIYDASPFQIQQLKLASGKKVIVAIKAKDQKAVDLHRQYIGIADDFIFDGGSSSYGASSGFNWDYLKTVKCSFLLAGGIGLGNIEEALKVSRRIDLSSKLEDTTGKKSVKKIKEFLLEVKRINDSN